MGAVFYFETFYNILYNTLPKIEFDPKNKILVSSADDFNFLLQLVKYYYGSWIIVAYLDENVLCLMSPFFDELIGYEISTHPGMLVLL